MSEITQKNYQKDPYLTEASGRLILLEKSNGGVRAVFDSTIFFPEGGGQPADQGSIEGVRVFDVQEEDGRVVHYLQQMPNWQIGDELAMAIDWPRRFSNMQRHLGEHILSGVIWDMFSGENRGFHMGDEYVTIDILLQQAKKLTWDMAMCAEKRANEIIWLDAKVETAFFESVKEATQERLRKDISNAAIKGAKDGAKVSVVTVSDGEKTYDRVACCGTHPSSCGQVGLIKIYKIEKNKDMWRIYFDAGDTALERLGREHEIISRITDRYSAGIDDIEAKMQVAEGNNMQARQRLNDLLAKITQSEGGRILNEITAGEQGIYFETFSDMTADDILKMSKIFADKASAPVLIYSKLDKTLMLFSDGTIDCGELVRDNADIYNAKGGGNKKLARAIFPREEDVPVFVDLIAKYLQLPNLSKS